MTQQSVGARTGFSSRDPSNGGRGMTANVLVTFYSTYGHVHRMALTVAEGAEKVPDSTVRLRRIAELEEARKALSAQDAYVQDVRPCHSLGDNPQTGSGNFDPVR